MKTNIHKHRIIEVHTDVYRNTYTQTYTHISTCEHTYSHLETGSQHTHREKYAKVWEIQTNYHKLIYINIYAWRKKLGNTTVIKHAKNYNPSYKKSDIHTWLSSHSYINTL